MANIVTGLAYVNAQKRSAKRDSMAETQAALVAAGTHFACPFIIPNPAHPDDHSDAVRCFAWLEKREALQYARRNSNGDIELQCPRDRANGGSTHRAVMHEAITRGWLTLADAIEVDPRMSENANVASAPASKTSDKPEWMTDAEWLSLTTSAPKPATPAKPANKKAGAPA